ncbi:MAG: hypothetical protein Q7I89_08295 [Syntrophales bacterium]|nr:hypothetical protein [Syntrophales bacterium]
MRQSDGQKDAILIFEQPDAIRMDGQINPTINVSESVEKAIIGRGERI